MGEADQFVFGQGRQMPAKKKGGLCESNPCQYKVISFRSIGPMSFGTDRPVSFQTDPLPTWEHCLSVKCAQFVLNVAGWNGPHETVKLLLAAGLLVVVEAVRFWGGQTVAPYATKLSQFRHRREGNSKSHRALTLGAFSRSILGRVEARSWVATSKPELRWS